MASNHIWYNNPRKARIHTFIKEIFLDGSVLSIVVWQLPEPTEERPHGYKYRLNYSAANGQTRVRFDNELGKGNHKHIGDIEEIYEFQSIEKLFSDFFNEIKSAGDRS